MAPITTRSQLLSEVYFLAMRSRGPGGQHVNKTASGAQLYWDFRFSRLLSEEQKLVVARRLERWINRDGLITLRSDEHRDLERNKEACLDKLLADLAKAFTRVKVRRPTKPTRASKERRLQAKASRSAIKKGRGRWRRGEDGD